MFDIIFVFFFQAEDGIRDYKVTGVQTCALPISEPAAVAAPPLRGTIEVARHVERRCGPEDPLDDPALHAHDGAVGQERVDEHPVATDRVRAEDQRQAGPPLAPDEGEPAGLGLGDAPFAPAPAPAERLAPGLRLLTR